MWQPARFHARGWLVDLCDRGPVAAPSEFERDVDPSFLDAISDVGLGALLIGVLIGGYRGWWIFGPIHTSIVRDLVEQRNFWRTQALRGTNLAERAVDVAVKPDA